MKILMIGPQGSGKSTQAELLSKFLNIPKISTGDIFRELSKEVSEEAKRVKEILSQGKLVDDETTAAIVRKRVQKENGFILDGYPRNIHQIELFDPDFDKVIYLNVPRKEAVKRLLARKRADDSEELINKRLELYDLQTQPLLNYYQKQGKLVEVSGMGDINQIHYEIQKFL